MKKIIVILITFNTLSALASDITCGRMTKLSAHGAFLETELTLRDPAFVNNQGKLEPKNQRKEVVTLRFNNPQEFNLHWLIHKKVADSIRKLYGDVFVCTSPRTKKLGINGDMNNALNDLINHLKVDNKD